MTREKKYSLPMRDIGIAVNKHLSLPADSVMTDAVYDDQTKRMIFTFSHQTNELVKEPETVEIPEAGSVPESATGEKKEKKK